MGSFGFDPRFFSCFILVHKFFERSIENMETSQRVKGTHSDLGAFVGEERKRRGCIAPFVKEKLGEGMRRKT